MRLTVETVGIRLSVCLSVSVRQAESLDSALPVSTVEVICPSVCLLWCWCMSQDIFNNLQVNNNFCINISLLILCECAVAALEFAIVRQNIYYDCTNSLFF